MCLLVALGHVYRYTALLVTSVKLNLRPEVVHAGSGRDPAGIRKPALVFYKAIHRQQPNRNNRVVLNYTPSHIAPQLLVRSSSCGYTV